MLFVKRLFFVILLMVAMALSGCRSVSVNPVSNTTYRPSDANFSNPERGYKSLTYFQHAPFNNPINVATYRHLRQNNNVTLHQHVYYLSDFMESDISQEYLSALDANMQALRETGCKCILRFAYKYEYTEQSAPYDPTPEWVNRHIEQLTPYLVKNGDVIFCLEAGFIGVWGEWAFTSGYTQMADRWTTLDCLLSALPVSRQICLRTPAFKKQYLAARNLPVEPVSETTAHQGTASARLAAHNDCFLSSNNDVGTYANGADRDFWAQDSRYTLMGGEICLDCAYSEGERAVQKMEEYHYTYLNDWSDIRTKWEASGHWLDISRRLGYRLVLDRTAFEEGRPEGDWEVQVTLHNEGFAAPVNPRAVELVLVQGTDTLVFPQNSFYPDAVGRQTIDPRFWLPNEDISLHLTASLPSSVHGEYTVYLNLPDPCPTLHDNPDFSIRFANEDVWEPATGYNRLAMVTF